MTRVTCTPETVHTVVVSEVKLTVRPEEAVALRLNGAVPYGISLREPNVIVWLDWPMLVSEKVAVDGTPAMVAVTE